MIGNKIKYLRKEKRLSQRDFAKALNIANGTVSMWENNIRTPDLNDLYRLADFFKIDIADLISKNNTIKNEHNINFENNNLTEEQKALIEKITKLNLDNFQCKRLNLYIDRMIEDDKKEEETVKKLYNQYHSQNKNIN